MEKYLRQFAPFAALIVAAILVVVANPADTGGDSDDSEVAGISERRSTTTVPAAAADIPTDSTGGPSDAEPFAAPITSSGSDSSFSTPTFSSGSSSSSSASTPSFSATSESVTTTTAFSTFSPGTTEAPTDSTTTTVPVASGSDFYLFEAMATSAACSAGGDATKPLGLASAYQQSVHTSEPFFPDQAAGIASNKADPDSERYLYRAHTLVTNGAISITDTASSNSTRILSQRSHWERLDGLVWTPNRTLLVGENVRSSDLKDSDFLSQTAPNTTQAKGGHVYEINPTTGVPTLRSALGSKAHKGMSFDHLGVLYAVSSGNPGYVYRFIPAGNTASGGPYSAGDLAVLQVTPNGESNWLTLNDETVSSTGVITGRNAGVLMDTDEAARLAGATQFLNPEDAEVMIITSPTGAKRSQLFIAEQGANRIVTVVLRATGTTSDATAFTSVYVAPGVNAPADFKAPSEIAIDVTYNLYIAERNGGHSTTSKTQGDDIWVAPANGASAIQSLPVGRLASLTDCDAEPAGLMFDLTTSKMYLNVKHRGGDGRDLTVLVTKSGGQ